MCRRMQFLGVQNAGVDMDSGGNSFLQKNLVGTKHRLAAKPALHRRVVQDRGERQQ